HHAHAHAVQSAGNFVSGSIEFSAGVQLGHDYLGGGNFFFVNHHVVHGDAAAVIDHGDGVINVDGDFDLVGEASQGFIYGVVHDFVDQVMQAQLAGGTDVHGRALAHRFHATENFDGVGSVIAIAVAAFGD